MAHVYLKKQAVHHKGGTALKMYKIFLSILVLSFLTGCFPLAPFHYSFLNERGFFMPLKKHAFLDNGIFFWQ